MILRLSIELIVITGAIIVILGTIPTSFLFSSFPLEPNSYEPVRTVKQEWNTFLSDNAQLLLQNNVVGPESLEMNGDYIYTGLSDGRLIEINKNTLAIRTVTSFEKQSDVHVCYDLNYWSIDKCGRPLGMRFHSDGKLYVIDATTGLYQVDIKTGEKKLIALGENDKNLPPQWSGLYNDLVFDPIDSNIVYLTVTTKRWPMRQIIWSIFEHENSGLLLAINLKTGKIAKITDGFYFLNSVEISADKKFLLASETSLLRILKYNLNEIHEQLKKDIKELTIVSQIFSDHLPGEIDNIRLYNGKIYAGFATARINQNPSLGDRSAGFTLIKKSIGRLIYSLSLAVKYINNYLYKHEFLNEFEYILNSGYILHNVIPMSGSIGILDGNTGKLERLLGSDKFSFVSEVLIDHDNGDLYFGSFRNRFIGKIDHKVL